MAASHLRHIKFMALRKPEDRSCSSARAAAKARWSMLQNDVTRILVPLNATAQNLSTVPTATWPPAIAVRVIIYREGNWIVVEDALRTVAIALTRSSRAEERNARISLITDAVERRD